METFDKELVQELRLRSEVVDNILSIGQIIHLTVLEPTNPTFLTQVILASQILNKISYMTPSNISEILTANHFQSNTL